MAIEGLHDQIRKKFKTDAAFGLAMGWIPQKVMRLKNGEYIPKLGEAVKMSRVLEVTLDELASFFTS